MILNQDLEKKEQERRIRRKWFYFSLVVFVGSLSVFLLWKLSSLVVPIILGALLAYLFRPLKDRMKISWLSHEMRVLSLFACIGLLIFMAINHVRKQMPDDRQKVELKVRLKYKLNEKFQQIAGDGQRSVGAIGDLIAREAGPMMDQLNHWLDLSLEEQSLFLSVHKSSGLQNSQDRFLEYFKKNQETQDYVKQATEVEGSHAAEGTRQAASVSHHAPSAGLHSGLMESLSIWILTPIIFLFMGFDNGQMRRQFIALVPNRYFELSLTVLDTLDEAIGNYLRGTLMECFLVGLTFVIGLALLGIPLSVCLAIGVISGLVNAIPFLGTVIGLVIGLGYALIAEDVQPLLPGLNPNDLALYVVILVVVAHVLDNVVYQPFVLGSAVNLHPLVVVVAIIGGSLMMGMLGMLLAVPVVVVLKTATQTLVKELKDYRII